MNATIAFAVLAAVLGTAEPSALSFSEFFRPGGARLEPSEKLTSLDGQRVRMTGFMARMEEAPSGAFYLASRPVVCDEGGAGTGDLPPDAVLVVVPWSAGETVRYLSGPLEVTGTLRIGGPARTDGMPARIQIVLDPPTPKSEGGKKP
jgi:hypothetical protein